MTLALKFNDLVRHKNGKTYRVVRANAPTGGPVEYAPEDYVSAVRLLPNGEMAPGPTAHIKAKYLKVTK